MPDSGIRSISSVGTGVISNMVQNFATSAGTGLFAWQQLIDGHGTVVSSGHVSLEQHGWQDRVECM